MLKDAPRPARYRVHYVCAPTNRFVKRICCTDVLLLANVSTIGHARLICTYLHMSNKYACTLNGHLCTNKRTGQALNFDRRTKGSDVRRRAGADTGRGIASGAKEQEKERRGGERTQMEKHTSQVQRAERSDSAPTHDTHALPNPPFSFSEFPSFTESWYYTILTCQFSPEYVHMRAYVAADVSLWRNDEKGTAVRLLGRRNTNMER